MTRRHIVTVAGLLAATFGLGLWLGTHVGRVRKPYGIAIVPATSQPSRNPAEPPLNDSTPCVDIRNAGPLVGKTGCVAGLVVRAYSARTGNTFLDFCEDYRTCPFTSVIFATDKDKFGDLESLQGKRVEIRGDVVRYQDRAEIIIRDPDQVRSAP